MNTRDIVLIALFAAIIVVLGLLPPITLGFIPVPITAQSLGVMLAGVILGAKRGAIAVLLVLLLVAIGLPVLSGGRGGLAVFAGPTVGYLIGWLPGAFLTGFISERFVKDEQSAFAQISGFFIAAVAGGIGAVYLCGIIGLVIMKGLPFFATLVGSLTFVPGDLVKAAIVALAARAVQVGYPLLPVRR